MAVRRACRRWVCAALLWGAAFEVATPVRAQDVDVAGNVTVVGQATTDDAIRDEIVSSFDLFVDVHLGGARIHTFVEANTTPFSGGVSQTLPSANGDAGTALSSRGNGRLQLSELRLVWPLREELRAHVGLLDATGFIDVSRIANDENLFFLGVPFVNNPVIHFPDYTLGAAVEGRLPGPLPLTVGAVVARSRGIADDPCACYESLFEWGGERGGAFLGAALRWARGDERVSVGGWVDTSERAGLDALGTVGTARGLFAVLGHTLGAHSVSFRVGLGNGDVTVERGFMGLTYLVVRARAALGLAVARTYVSDALPDMVDRDRGEAFLRFRFFRAIFATLSLQRLASGEAATGSTLGSGLWIGGVRLSAQF